MPEPAGDHRHMALGPEIRGLGKNELKMLSAINTDEIVSVHRLIFELNVLLEGHHSALLRQVAHSSRTSK